MSTIELLSSVVVSVAGIVGILLLCLGPFQAGAREDRLRGIEQ